MILKAVEIRDKHTFIPAIAIQMTPKAYSYEHLPEPSNQQTYLLRRCGWTSGEGIILVKMQGNECHGDPYDWGSRTMTTAHLWLVTDNHFELTKDGDVIDVEFILKESPTVALSERFQPPTGTSEDAS